MATPTCAIRFPPDENDEAQTVNLIGDFGDSVSGPTPVEVRVARPLEAKAPGASAGPSSGTSAEKRRSLAGGPYIVDAWTIPPWIYRVDRNRCEVGQDLRAGDVVERAHRLSDRRRSRRPGRSSPTAPSTGCRAAGPSAIAPLEVADLHDHETSFNADNMHDLCLPRPARGATLAGVTIGADLIQDPNGDPNLAQRFRA